MREREKTSLKQNCKELAKKVMEPCIIMGDNRASGQHRHEVQGNHLPSSQKLVSCISNRNEENYYLKIS